MTNAAAEAVSPNAAVPTTFPAWREPAWDAAEEDAAIAGARRAERALARATAPDLPLPVLDAVLDEMYRGFTYRRLDRRSRVNELVRRTQMMAEALAAVAAAVEFHSPDPVPRALRLLGSGNGHRCPGPFGLRDPEWTRGHRARCGDCWRTAQKHAGSRPL